MTSEQAMKALFDRMRLLVNEAARSHPDDPKAAADQAVFGVLCVLDGVSDNETRCSWALVAEGPCEEDVAMFADEGEDFAPEGLTISGVMLHEHWYDKGNL